MPVSSNIKTHQVLVGSAPDSWGVWFPTDERQIPADRFLDELTAAGYRYLELGPWGYLPTETKALTAELDKRGLSLAATTIIGDLTDDVASAELLRTLEIIAPVQHALGAHYVVLIAVMYTDLFSGKKLRGPELTPAEWSRLIANTERIAKMANAEIAMTNTQNNGSALTTAASLELREKARLALGPNLSRRHVAPRCAAKP